MSLVLLVLFVYVGLQLALGVWVSRRVSSQQDYLLGGRTLGLGLCTASMFATWFGAETCIGAAGEVYQHGLAAVSADPFGYGLCLILFGLFIAGELRARGYVTLADLFGDRFSPAVERVVALLLLPGSVLWAAAQIRAFGQVFASAAPGLDPTLGITYAAGITILYTASGGLLADVYTDLLQGVVLVVTLVALALIVCLGIGPLDAVWSQVSAGAPAVGHAEQSPFGTLNDWAVPIAGSLFTQEIISRAVASKTATVARRGALVAGALYLVLGTIPVLLGLVARVVLPPTESVEQVLPQLARHVLGELGFVIFAGTLVSAILSTVDSALLAGGALIVQNVVAERARKLSEAAKLRLTRWCVAGLGVLAFIVAMFGASVHELVQESSALGSAGLFVAGLLGLFTRFGGARAALMSLSIGGATYVYAEHVLESEVAYLTSIAGAALGYALGALGDARSSAAHEVVTDKAATDTAAIDKAAS
jgi:Na+/proline symporter